MPYSINDIQKILAARWLQKSDPDAGVEQLLFDSRQVAMPSRSLFFALSGERLDGHRYLPDLYRVGVRQFIVSQAVAVEHYPDAKIGRAISCW